MSDDYVDFRDDLGVRSARTTIAFSIFSPPSTDLSVLEPPMPMIFVRMSPHVASRPRRVVGIGVQNDHPWVYDLANRTWTDLGFVAHGSNSVGFTPSGDVIVIIDQGRAWWVEGVGKIPNPPADPNYQSGQGFLDVRRYTHWTGQGDGAVAVETWQPQWLDDQLSGRLMFEPIPGVRFLRWMDAGDFRSGQDAYADRVLVWAFSTSTLSIAANRYTSVAPLIGTSSTEGAVCAISLPGLFVTQAEWLPYTPPAPVLPVIGRAAFWTPFEFARPSRA